MYEGSPFPSSHKGQFGLSYQPQPGFPPGKGLGSQDLPPAIPLAAGKRKKLSPEMQMFSNRTPSSLLGTLAVSAATSSLRKAFPLDNVTGVPLPVPGLSLSWLWCVSPGLAHTVHPWSQHGLWPPFPDCCESCFCPLLCSTALLKCTYTTRLSKDHAWRETAWELLWVHQQIPLVFPQGSTLHSASHLLPLDLVL